MDKKYILFDLDGTLTDPKEGITRSVAYALDKYGIKVDDLDTLLPFIGPPLLDSFHRFYGFGDRQSHEALMFYREYFSKKGIFENALYDGVPQLLEKLRRRGKVVILATSKPEQYARQILEHFGIDGLFDHICGASMDESRSRKADVIAYALDTAGISDPSLAVMVGDRLHDIEGGHACGLETVGVLFGYGSLEELTAAGADSIAADMSELEAILMGGGRLPESLVVFFPCRDIEAVKSYYTGVLGLELYKDLGNTVWFDCGYGYLAFVDYGPDRALAGGQCISFNLPSREEVDEKYAELSRTPGVISLGAPPQKHPRFPVYSFFLSDPNGYTLEYQKVD